VTEALYPYGYVADANGVQGMGTMITMAQMEAKKTVYNLHPEFWRRYRALMEAAVESGMHLGVGTGWRVQPNPPPPGFASPGNSNHEGFPAGSTGAVAIDTVVAPSWPWMEKNLKLYGLRSFLYPSTTGYKGKNEPWHIQPAEIPASRMWRTQPWKLNTFPLPPTGTTPTPPPTPPPTNWAMDLMLRMPEIVRGMVGRYVLRVQHFLALAGEFDATNMANFDGRFGSGTEAAVKRFEGSHKLSADGRVDTKVWELFCAAGDGIPNLQVGSYGLDVQRMQRMLSANKFMDPANQANFDGQFGSGTQTAVKEFQKARLLTVDGKCGQQTWTSLLYG
jgi:peptidoglycan hydrolase-like protein with peptidoglycan-binding domain